MDFSGKIMATVKAHAIAVFRRHDNYYEHHVIASSCFTYTLLWYLIFFLSTVIIRTIVVLRGHDFYLHHVITSKVAIFQQAKS